MSGMLHLSAKNKKEKISIFRNLLKGREDVFAKYWVSRRTGKKGYSPVCKMSGFLIFVENRVRHAVTRNIFPWMIFGSKNI